MRGEIVGVPARRRLTDLDQTLLDRAFEIRVHKTQSYAKLGRDTSLRSRPVRLDGCQKTENYSVRAALVCW